MQFNMGGSMSSLGKPNIFCLKVFEVDENQMDVDQQSSSSSTAASVPAALTSSSQHVTTDTVSSCNIQHHNGYRNIENGTSQREGGGADSRPVMNGNINSISSTQK